MTRSPLPPHWAEPHGLGQARVDALEARRAAFKAMPVSERAAAQKSATAAFHEARAAAGAYADRGEVEDFGAGLVKDSTSPTDPSNSAAGEVVEFTSHEARMMRMSRAVKNAITVHKASAPDWPWAMFTLTHRPGEVPEPKDVSRFVDCLRKYVLRHFGVKQLRYVWVAELQPERAAKGDPGALHYHVAVALPPAMLVRAARRPQLRDSWVLPKPDKGRFDRRWWKKGDTERDWVRKSVKAYLAKYLSKGSETGYPRGARVHGAGGFQGDEKPLRSFLGLPRWLKEQVGPEDRCKRLPAGVWTYPDGRRESGGGWVSQLTGQTFKSPWKLVSWGRVIRIVRSELCGLSSVGMGANYASVTA